MGAFTSVELPDTVPGIGYTLKHRNAVEQLIRYYCKRAVNKPDGNGVLLQRVTGKTIRKQCSDDIAQGNQIRYKNMFTIQGRLILDNISTIPTVVTSVACRVKFGYQEFACEGGSKDLVIHAAQFDASTIFAYATYLGKYSIPVVVSSDFEPNPDRMLSMSHPMIRNSKVKCLDKVIDLPEINPMFFLNFIFTQEKRTVQCEVKLLFSEGGFSQSAKVGQFGFHKDYFTFNGNKYDLFTQADIANVSVFGYDAMVNGRRRLK